MVCIDYLSVDYGIVIIHLPDINNFLYLIILTDFDFIFIRVKRIIQTLTYI